MCSKDLVGSLKNFKYLFSAASLPCPKDQSQFFGWPLACELEAGAQI